MVTFLLDPKTTYKDSVMLVGDAAGFACPFEAEGVYYAMYSGMLAAKVALDAHGSGDTSASFLQQYESAWRASPVGEEFVGGEAIDGFVRGIGFNPDLGRWIVPMLNDAAYGLLNVAESHTASARNLGPTLVPYLPVLVETLVRDLMPLANKMAEPPPKRPSPGVERLLRRVLSPVLPFLARRAARANKSAYGDVMSDIIMRDFVKTYVEEKAREAGGAIR